MVRRQPADAERGTQGDPDQVSQSEFGTKRQLLRRKAMSGVGGKGDLPVERPDFSV